MKICCLASGSRGNSTYIESNNTSILVDAGLSAKDLTLRASQMDIDLKNLSGIVVTHEHIDHIRGVERLSKLYNIPIYMHEKSIERCPKLNAIFADANMDCDFEIGDLQISPFRLPHDSAYNQGYVVDDGKSVFAVATDLGAASDNVVKKLSRAECVLLESNHDINLLKNGSYPMALKQRILSSCGHLSNSDCAEVAATLALSGVKRLILAHLSEENNTPELAFEQTRLALEKNNIKEGEEIVVEVAMQYKPLRVIQF